MANENNMSIYTSTVPSLASSTNATYQRPFNDAAIIASGIVIFIFFVVGILLNSITIAVISGNPRLKNIFMSFIVSLCVCDLISAIISPLFWYRRTIGFDVWLPPNFFCEFYWAADIMTSYSTAMHILSFAVLRYLSIEYQSAFCKMSEKIGKLWIIIIWFIAFTCGFIPFWIFFGSKPGVIRDRLSGAKDAKYPACTVELEWFDAYSAYQIPTYSIFIYLPIVGLLVLSFLIARAVHAHSSCKLVTNDRVHQKRVRKEKQAVFQLLLIVLSFLIGYVPFATYEVWSMRSNDATADYWFGLTQYFCLRFSECLNPIFYNISSSKMRRETKKFFRKNFKCISDRMVASSDANTTPNTTAGALSQSLGV